MRTLSQIQRDVLINRINNRKKAELKMKTNQEINHEIIEVYNAIKLLIKESETDHCQSWWLNTRNFNMKSRLSTPEINRRAKKLVDQGYLTIYKNRTSPSMGTCYKLTDKCL